MAIKKLVIYPISNGGVETWEWEGTLKFELPGGQPIVHQHDPKSTEPQTYECDFIQEAGTHFTGSLNTYGRKTGRGYQVRDDFPKITNQEELHVHITGFGPFLSFLMRLKPV